MPFTSIAEFEATESPTTAERALIAACKSGTPCYLPDGNPETATLPPEGEPTPNRHIRAELLRLLILGGTQDCGLDPVGVALVGAHITETLDLRFRETRSRLLLLKCRFAKKPIFELAGLIQLNLSDSHMPGLFARGLTVKEGLYLVSTTTTGPVDVSAAKIGMQLNCERACLERGANNDESKISALKAQGAEVRGSLILQGAKIRGKVDLCGAKIDVQLNCFKAEFDGDGDDAFLAQGLLVAQGFIFRDIKKVIGRVNLTTAHVGDLEDKDCAWPTGPNQLDLNGFTYDRIPSGPLTFAARAKWLATGSVFEGTFSPQPYTQFAKVLREMGHVAESRQVLMARQKAAARHARVSRHIKQNGDVPVAFRSLWAVIVNALAYISDGLANHLIGYGYQPWKALLWLAVVWASASFTAQQTWNQGSFAPNSDVILVSAGWAVATDSDCIPADQAPPNCDWNPANTWSNDAARGLDWDSFNAQSYGADLVIPFVDLGQTSAWAPSKDRGTWGQRLWWGRWVFELLGWIITALGIAAITGFVQKNQPE